MKRLFSVFLIICLFSIFLLSCNTNLSGHELIGIWEHDGNRIEFTSNGYFIKGNEKYTFSVNENKITIDENGLAMTVEYTVNTNGTLSMNNLIYYPVRKG